ncbi:MAG TPA: hypothetical protein DEA08_28945 [Planctomycetes bacterium]|nr:hypothetical protein [Planctomycetota bacterium]
MPGYPHLAPRVGTLRPSPFAAFADRIARAQRDPEFVPLHLGDTYPLPPEAARRVVIDEPSLHRYGPVGGDLELREAGAADLRQLGLSWAETATTFVTPGATGGLDVACATLFAPGDEVIVLTPSWPLIFGILTRHGATLVQTPVSESGALPEPSALAARVEAALTDKSAGLYLCNPNNPVGFTYSAEHLAALCELVVSRGLWFVCDSVYTDLLPDLSIKPLAALPESLAERTSVVTSYSKSLGLAGHRVGLLSAAPAVAAKAAAMQTFTTYHPSRIGQAMALASLQRDAAESRAGRSALVKEGIELTLQHLRGVVPLVAEPEGGAFVFLDLRERAADGDALLQLLLDCMDQGVSLAPGEAFGDDFARFARLCYTAVPPERLRVGLERLAQLLG